MSRSYKKTAGWTDHGRYTKWWKRQANKRVRRTKNLDSGGVYKRVFQSYQICDYKFLYFSDEEITRMEEKRLHDRLNSGWWGYLSWMKVGDERYKYWMK